MDFANQEIAKGEKSLKIKQFNLVDSYIFNADSKLKQVGMLLDKVINNSKADPSHPEIAAAFARQETLRKKLSAFKSRASGSEEADAQAKNRARENAAELNRK